MTTIPGQPPPSPTLKKALDLLAAGQDSAAEEAVRAAAIQAKSQSGSGSLPLARAYADMARLHFRTGDYKKAAAEFRHACEGPMPPDATGRKDRLAFMFGFVLVMTAASFGSPAIAADLESGVAQSMLARPLRRS